MASPLVAGTDEAGRGPLAGSVFAAAVILDNRQSIPGLDDSKRLTERRREALFDQICERARCWHIASCSVEEIDTYNILQASLLAMRRAVDGLNPPPQLVLVDGNRLPDWPYRSRAIVGGDASEPAIAAASILAKVARDREMCELAKAFPQYGFERHKGYPTAEHRRVLEQLGPCRIHRRSFAPVQRQLFPT